MKKNPNARLWLKLAALALPVLLLGTFLVLRACKKDASPFPDLTQPSLAPTTEPTTLPPPSALNPLTGLPMRDKKAQGKRPFVCMVNNAPPARPQWGLCAADIVLEGLVEGGTTRMLWMFADVRDMPKIGPIRSARHDFAELASGLDAVYIHWGGSPQAYDTIAAQKISNINGMKGEGSTFHRDKTRKVSLEHRGYTTGKDIQKAMENQKIRTAAAENRAEPFVFAPADNPRTLSGGAAASVSFRFSQSFRYSFAYDKKTKLYAQSMNEKPFLQDGGEQRTVTNVVLLYLNFRVLDEKGRVDMDLSEGEGLYLSGGKQENIRWKKGAAANPLQLLTAGGEPLTLNAGQSYIGLVPKGQQGKTIVK